MDGRPRCKDQGVFGGNRLQYAMSRNRCYDAGRLRQSFHHDFVMFWPLM